MDLAVFLLNLGLCAGAASALEYEPPQLSGRVVSRLVERAFLRDLAQGHWAILIAELSAAGMGPAQAERAAGAAVSRAKADILDAPQSRTGLLTHLRNRFDYLASRLEPDLRMKAGVLFQEGVRAIGALDDGEAVLAVSTVVVRLDGMAVEESQVRSLSAALLRLRVPPVVSADLRLELSPEDRRTVELAERSADTKGIAPSALLRLGNVRYLRGDLAGARKLYLAALEREPRLAEARAMLADALLAGGDARQALEHAAQALAVNAAIPQAWTVLGEAYERAGVEAKAEECFQRALALDPRLAIAWNDLGAMHKDRGSLEQARRCFERAIELAPHYPPPWNNIGSIYAVGGASAKAVECYRRAIELDPRYAAAWNNLGAAYGDSGDHEREAECYGKALELDPGRSMVWNNLGAACQVTGDTRRARECFRRALELDPKNEAAKRNLESLGG